MTDDKKKKLIAAVSAAAVIIIVTVLLITKMSYNPYLKDYIDTTGTTIGELAQKQGMSYDDFLKLYELPKDMPKDTPENAAFYHIPLHKYADMYGSDTKSFLEMLELQDNPNFNENTPIGDVFDAASLKVRVGKDKLEDFKKEYGLSDVTLDTKWKDVRNTVDEKIKENHNKSNGGDE